MRNLVTLFIIFIALLQPARSICAEDYYQTGYKYGKDLGRDIGLEERTLCVKQHRDPISVKEAWGKLFSKEMEEEDPLFLLFLKEQGVDPNPKTAKDKQLFIQTLNQFTELLQNDAFGEGLTNGFAECYFFWTKDALYEGLQYKIGRMSDWEKGYVAGFERGGGIGDHDKKEGNPSNWFIRYTEIYFRPLDSTDAQYLYGFSEGFKAGYLSGYR